MANKRSCCRHLLREQSPAMMTAALLRSTGFVAAATATVKVQQRIRLPPPPPPPPSPTAEVVRLLARQRGQVRIWKAAVVEEALLPSREGQRHSLGSGSASSLPQPRVANSQIPQQLLAVSVSSSARQSLCPTRRGPSCQ